MFCRVHGKSSLHVAAVVSEPYKRQHYNPIIDDAVREVFEVKESWKLIAQMPFGKCEGSAGDKTFLPVDERMLMLG